MINSDVTIIKNNHNSIEVWRYAGKIIAESPKGIIAEAYFNRSDFEFNGILLKGLLKAWYCNITRPVCLAGNTVLYDDLALDLLVYPDRRQLPLDEDEFIALGLNKADQQNARSALIELQTLFFQTEMLNIRDLV
jgi:protein associated with RNAse G/E